MFKITFYVFHVIVRLNIKKEMQAMWIKYSEMYEITLVKQAD